MRGDQPFVHNARDQRRDVGAGIAIINGTIAAALGLGLQQWLVGIAIWAIGHSIAVFAARRDPDFMPVLLRHLRQKGYPEAAFPDAASWLVDQERRAGFEAEGQHFESRFHGTLTWLPPADSSDAAGRTLVEQPDDAKGRDWRASLAGFVAETDRVLDLLSGFMPEVRALSDAETLTYLHDTISSRRHPVAVPETPIYLDALLTDTPLVGGWSRSSAIGICAR